MKEKAWKHSFEIHGSATYTSPAIRLMPGFLLRPANSFDTPSRRCYDGSTAKWSDMMSIDNATDALQVLQNLYAIGFSDPVTDRILQKTVESQASRDAVVLRDLERDLAELEGKYGMSSKAFFERWQAGELEDNFDFMDWNALYQMTQRVEKRLELLQGENGH